MITERLFVQQSDRYQLLARQCSGNALVEILHLAVVILVNLAVLFIPVAAALEQDAVIRRGIGNLHDGRMIGQLQRSLHQARFQFDDLPAQHATSSDNRKLNLACLKRFAGQNRCIGDIANGFRGAGTQCQRMRKPE